MFSTRTACANDLPAICDLANQINRQHWRMHSETFIDPDQCDSATLGDPGLAQAATTRLSQHDVFWRRQLDAPDGTMLVAHQAETVVGFVSATILPVTEIPFLAVRRVCRIGTLVVDATTQGSGIGGALMAAAEEWARRRDVVEMRLEVFDFNRNALRFYDNAGFAVQSHIMTKALR